MSYHQEPVWIHLNIRETLNAFETPKVVLHAINYEIFSRIKVNTQGAYTLREEDSLVCNIIGKLSNVRQIIVPRSTFIHTSHLQCFGGMEAKWHRGGFIWGGCGCVISSTQNSNCS